MRAVVDLATLPSATGCEASLASDRARAWKRTLPRQSRKIVSRQGRELRQRWVASASGTPSKSQFKNANFPTDSDGRTYHLGVKPGELANRVLSVGDASRGARIAQLLDPPTHSMSAPFMYTSSRGFVTYTGKFQEVPVSIVVTLMGYPNMDFVLREARAVVEGEMAVIRLGSCGSVNSDVHVGTVVVAAEGSVAVRRNPNAFSDCNPKQAVEPEYLNGKPTIGNAAVLPYEFLDRVPSDSTLSALALKHLHSNSETESAIGGLNCSGDTFYASQGRVGEDFVDRNDTLIDDLIAANPRVISVEMETFHLLDLARCSGESIRATAAAIVLACRNRNEFINFQQVATIERAAGRSLLQALAEMPLVHSASENTFETGACEAPYR